jgi:tetratricopeptide (TPR) repeat protein
MAGNRELYEQSMNTGHNAAWDQEWEQAVQAYGQAIQEFPENPEAHIHLGLALLEAGRLEQALKVYTRAHKLAPDDPIPVEKSADVLERMGRLKEAAQQYINVAEIYFAQRDLDKTIGNWERATRLTPGLVQIHAKLGQLREKIGDRKGAVREYLTLAFNFQRMGEVDRARKAAERALRLDKDNPQVLNTIRAIDSGSDIVLPPEILAVAAQSQFDSTNGASGSGITSTREAEAIGEADPLGPMGEAMNEALTILASFVIEESSLDASGGDALQAMEWQRQGLTDEAIGAYQRAETNLRHPALKLNLGVLLVLANRPDEAVKQLGEATMHEQLSAGAFHALGYAYYKMAEHKRAARFLIQSVQAVDTSLAVDTDEAQELASVYERLTVSLEDRGEESLARVNQRFLAMLEGADWKQRIAETRRQIEDSVREQGEQGALDLLAVGRSDEVTDSVGRIDHYIRNGYLTLAMDEAHRAVEVAPQYLPIHIRMAEIMMREGRVRNAITKYNTVAKTYLVRNENDRAAAILSEVLEMAPLDITVRQNLIELLENEARWDEAVDQYADLADTYHQLGNFDLARQTFSMAERIGTRENVSVDRLVRIKHRMADIDQMRLDTRKAQKTYEEIVELKADDERAHRMLVEINFRQGNQIEGIRRLDKLLGLYARRKQGEKITKILEEMVGVYANDPGLRHRLAAIYQQLDRKGDAIKQLDALGELQLEAGLHEEAAITIRKIIALNPDGADDYKRLLSQLGR